MSAPTPEPDAAGLHLATIAHEGLLWDAYLQFEDDTHHPPTFRGRLRFNRAGVDGVPKITSTTVIIIEASYEEAVAKARRFDERQLGDLLRSTLPEEKGRGA